MTKFTTVVSRIKTQVRRKARRLGMVSAVDIANISRDTSGSRRGAIVRRVFADLVAEGFLTPTAATICNRDTRHRVTVYKMTSR